MIVAFTPQNPYTRDFMVSSPLANGMTFLNINDALLVGSIPASITSIRLYNSPNVRFAQESSSVKQIVCAGHVDFNDAMFRLDRCAVIEHGDCGETTLEQNQLTLNYAKEVVLINLYLDVNSLLNVRVPIVSIYNCTDMIRNALNRIVPTIAHGVAVLTIFVVGPSRRLRIQLANIPDSLRRLIVPYNELSDASMEMFHRHTQRIRYQRGAAAENLTLYCLVRDQDET